MDTDRKCNHCGSYRLLARAYGYGIVDYIENEDNDEMYDALHYRVNKYLVCADCDKRTNIKFED